MTIGAKQQRRIISIIVLSICVRLVTAYVLHSAGILPVGNCFFVSIMCHENNWTTFYFLGEHLYQYLTLTVCPRYHHEWKTRRTTQVHDQIPGLSRHIVIHCCSRLLLRN